MRKLAVGDLRRIILQESRSLRRPRAPQRRSLASILFEDADAKAMDPERFPLKLSAVDAAAAKKVTQTGSDDIDKGADDDVIGVESKPEGVAAVANLKPSQSSMNIGKAMTFVLHMIDHPAGKMEPGGDLGAFISDDGYIMDGHHRWIATAMVDPSKSVGGYLVNFPGRQLVAILNALTKGQFGVEQGKAASGGFDQFKEGPIGDQLKSMVTGGISAETVPDTFKGWQALSPEEVVTAIESWTGEEGDAAVDAAVKKMAGNLAGISMETPEWAPERPDMPVIDEPDVPAAVTALSGGHVDVNEPYGELEGEVELEEPSDDEGKEKKLAAGVNRKDGLIMERWRHLAGLV